ncbi:fibronectin-binding protein [Candidatus Woesearchaeota archaeon]|nr:fibronectin-binding protein [Candidatus Woesearchaeota archaeon]
MNKKSILFLVILGVIILTLSGCDTNSVSDVEKDDLEGDYFVKGTNQIGLSYTGTLEITKKDNSYKVAWDLGEEKYTGIGILEGNVFTVDWGQEHPVIYNIQENGTLEGTWANGVGTETLVPFK